MSTPLPSFLFWVMLPRSKGLFSGDISVFYKNRKFPPHYTYIHYTCTFICIHYSSTGCQVFSSGGIKLERFLLKNQHTQRKFLNFENWCNGEVSKFDFRSQFSMSKIIRNFLISFFPLKNINLGAHFLFLTCFDNVNF